MTATQERVAFKDPHLVTMRELNQNTAAVIDAVNESGQPAVVTKHGRFVALLTPLAGQNLEGRLAARLLEEQGVLAPGEVEVQPGKSTADLMRDLGAHDEGA